ncbi:hypothetical protein BY996DRAFT_128208 [Phakopsora pachyrhizi]|nr:hypothetical protein BY996DRAFT_128208 [Phakopsora pachyrhizi]
MLSYNPSVPSIDESATKCLDQRSPSPYKFNKLDSSQPKDNLGKINTSDQLPATTTTTLIESTASPYHSVDSINRSAASAGLRNSTARSDSALTSNSSLRAPRRTCPNPSLSRHLNRPVSSQRPINNPSCHQPTPRATLSSSSPSSSPSSPSPSSSAVSSPTFSFSRVSTPISLLSPTSSLPGDPSLHLAQAGRKTSLYRGSSSKPNLTQPPLCELLEEEKEAFSLTEAISNKPGEKNHSSLGLDSSVNRTSLKCEKPVLAQPNPKNINLSSPLGQL